MKSNMERMQELDDELKKILQEAADKSIDRETAIKKIAQLRKEIKLLMGQIRKDKK